MNYYIYPHILTYRRSLHLREGNEDEDPTVSLYVFNIETLIAAHAAHARIFGNESITRYLFVDLISTNLST